MSTRKRLPACRSDISIQRASRRVPVPSARLKQTIRHVLNDEQVAAAELSVAIVDDAEIHRVNREHLSHDHPTDVISFLYEARPSTSGVTGAGRSAAQEAPGPPDKKRSAESDASARLTSNKRRRGSGLIIEGELIVSDETALREAPRHGLAPAAELQLYVIHGLLHLCGYDDLTPAEKRIMRRRERELMTALGLT